MHSRRNFWKLKDKQTIVGIREGVARKIYECTSDDVPEELPGRILKVF